MDRAPSELSREELEAGIADISHRLRWRKGRDMRLMSGCFGALFGGACLVAFIVFGISLADNLQGRGGVRFTVVAGLLGAVLLVPSVPLYIRQGTFVRVRDRRPLRARRKALRAELRTR